MSHLNPLVFKWIFRVSHAPSFGVIEGILTGTRLRVRIEDSRASKACQTADRATNVDPPFRCYPHPLKNSKPEKY